jgi:predicted O-methyltransferase YrrM
LENDRWSQVDDYLADKLIQSDSVLEAALANNARASLPAIDVSPTQGKFLHLIARLIGARCILEIGTLGGYSTICLARALPPDGLVISLEAMKAHAEVARANLALAGLTERVDIRIGRALDTLPVIAAEKRDPFDLVFIDADKENNRNYLAWALRLARPGTVIIIDNVIRDGRVIDPSSTDSTIQGTRQLFDAMAEEPRLSATAIQTVGVKGWDGFVLAVVDNI